MSSKRPYFSTNFPGGCAPLATLQGAAPPNPCRSLLAAQLGWTRQLADGQIKTITLYSDPYPNTNQNPNPNHSPDPNPNVKFDLLPYMAMSRDIT